jgi:parallel beta-helix repeat protein
MMTALGMALPAANVGATTEVNARACYAFGGQPDSAALQAAINVASGLAAGFVGTTGEPCGVPGSTVYVGSVYIPPRGPALGDQYLLNTELVVTRALTLRGVEGVVPTVYEATRGTILRLLSTTMTAIRINTQQPVKVEDLEIISDGQTAGSAIVITSPVDENNHSTIERVSMTHMWDGIHIQKGSWVTIRNCVFREPRHYGIWIQNTLWGDHGDNNITGNWIHGSVAGSVGVHHDSGGGIRFIDNKINGGAAGMAIGYRLAFNAQEGGLPRNSSILIIQGNSIEGQALRGIQLLRTGPSTYGKIIISGNQISGGNPNSSHVGIEFADSYGDDPAALYAVTITGNTITEWLYGIAIHEAKGVAISGNTIYNNAAATGVYLNTAAPHQSVHIGPNVFFDLGANIVGCTAPACTTCCGN